MHNIKVWTKFGGRPNKRPHCEGRIRVTLSPRGRFYLNAIAWEALGKPEAVELMLDLPRGVIGIAPAETWQENAFHLRPKDKKRGQGKVIFASPFCTHFNVRPQKRTLVFNNSEIDEDGVLSLPLESLSVSGKGAR